MLARAYIATDRGDEAAGLLRLIIAQVHSGEAAE